MFFFLPFAKMRWSKTVKLFSASSLVPDVQPPFDVDYSFILVLRVLQETSKGP